MFVLQFPPKANPKPWSLIGWLDRKVTSQKRWKKNKPPQKTANSFLRRLRRQMVDLEKETRRCWLWSSRWSCRVIRASMASSTEASCISAIFLSFLGQQGKWHHQTAPTERWLVSRANAMPAIQTLPLESVVLVCVIVYLRDRYVRLKTTDQNFIRQVCVSKSNCGSKIKAIKLQAGLLS